MSRIDEIEARLAAATPGPWAEGYDAGWTVDQDLYPDGIEIAAMTDQEGDQGRRDASLIAHAPADLAALVKFARDVAALHQPRTVYANEAHCTRAFDGDHAMGRHVEDRMGSWVCLDHELASECITCCDTDGATADYPCPTARAVAELDGGAS